ncbi:hypothetical protein HETIRDRAFT_456371 [Heterobasidion irregulare TC 32-1]|uniref:Uncharacterized protein n=1 Tax=Heterobasidion irregulare (strain TC 32-1) TaxID=747525 RepID=W4JPQ5_HETIT|nr:uncharacterized protein HETIRDRAFT_456371 [Heterobasidion irregulare TC 32-1]ETW74851.1 hypothetical protein HETIRDRAFT_456371 [Heterobasidion irregulare TC 32-1]
MPDQQMQGTTDGGPHRTIPLPIELVIEILEYTLVKRQYIRELALVSKLTTELYYKLVYRTIIPRTSRGIKLFERTAIDAQQGLIHEHVKRVIIIYLAWASVELLAVRCVEQSLCHDAWRIVRSCTGAHTFAFPGPFIPYFLKRLRSDPIRRITRHTHFTFGNFFVAPRVVLAHLGPLPRLTHLCVPRRLDVYPAHDAHDAAFVDDVRVILAERSALAHLVVGACPPLCKYKYAIYEEPRHPEAEEQQCLAAPVWRAIKALQETEARLLMVRGDVAGVWCREWDAVLFDFWADVVREGLLEREREALPEAERPLGKWQWP